MDFLRESCQDLNVADCTSDQCQQFIDQPHSFSDGDMFAPNMNNENILLLIKNISGCTLPLDNLDNLNNLKRITALTLSTLVNTNDSNGEFSFVLFLLKKCLN